MVLYTIIFFSLGAVVTWLCFCWKIDRDNSALYKRIRHLERQNSYLELDNKELKLSIEVSKNVISQWENLELERLRQREIVKQEKDKCPE